MKNIFLICAVLFSNLIMAQGVSNFGASRPQDTSKTKGQIVATAYANSNSSLRLTTDSKGHFILVAGGGGTTYYDGYGIVISNDTINIDSALINGIYVKKSDSTITFVTPTQLAAAIAGKTTQAALEDTAADHWTAIQLNKTNIASNLTRINNGADSTADNRDSINVHRTAIDGKEPSITPGTTDQYWQGDKTWQAKSGLPISTATQAALDGKISYSDTTTIIASQDYVNNAIADIPIIDSSRYVLYSDTARSGSVATYPYVDSLFNEVPPLVDSSRYVLYGDSNIVYVTPTQLNEAIADIPPLDTSNIVARIDSNANSINILDSTAYIGKPVNVQRVMLEGQSNCDGSDVDTTSLTTAPLIENQFYLLDTFERVYTWDYTNNVYKKLKAGYSNYGRTGASFGSELSFAARWEKNNPDGILVIDKKCLYGQTINQFQKGTTQYTTILNDRPLADKWLTDRGYRVKNTAWVFIQGESDLDSAGYQYLAALNQLVSDKFSDGLIDSTTRLVISQVSTSAPLYGAGVDSAQVAFVNAAPNRKLINNDANTLGVGNHYNAAGYVQLGLSAYTQSFDADSLKTLDEYVQYKGVGSIFGRLKVENSPGSSDEGAAEIGANAQLQVAADNFSYVPMIVHSTSNEVVNSSLIWCTADTAIMGTLFAVNNAFLIRGWLHKNLILGANNSQTQLFLQRYTNNVGINTVTPHSRLHVSGSARVTDTLHALGNIYANGIPAAATKDSILAIESNRVYKIPKPAGGSADSSTFFTNYRADTMRTNIYGAISAGGLQWSDTNVVATKYDIDTVNAKIPDVSGFISWIDTVSDIGTKYDVDTLATSIYGAGYLPSATAASTYVSLSGSYSNPTWITALAWSKITSTPTTLSGYGITDAVPNTRTVNGSPLSSDVTISTITGNAGTATALQTGRTIDNTTFDGTANIKLNRVWQGKLAGETDTLTTGVKLTFRMPYACTITGVKAAVNTASSSGNITIDIHENGNTIMATNKITIEATETTSLDATQQPVLTDTSIAADALMEVEVDVAGTNAISGEVTIYYTLQ